MGVLTMRQDGPSLWSGNTRLKSSSRIRKHSSLLELPRLRPHYERCACTRHLIYSSIGVYGVGSIRYPGGSLEGHVYIRARYTPDAPTTKVRQPRPGLRHERDRHHLRHLEYHCCRNSTWPCGNLRHGLPGNRGAGCRRECIVRWHVHTMFEQYVA